MIQKQKAHQPDILASLLTAVHAALGGELLTVDQVRDIEDAMRNTWGGQEVYIKKSSVDQEARALAIRTRYNLRNRRELQAEFQISRGQFYKIIKSS